MSMFVFHALNTLIVPILLCVSQQPSPLSFVVFPTSSGKGCSSPRDHAALQGASRISDAFFPHCLALLTISFSSARALILSPGHTHTPSLHVVFRPAFPPPLQPRTLLSAGFLKPQAPRRCPPCLLPVVSLQGWFGRGPLQPQSGLVVP